MNLLQDLRFACRLLLKDPWFTLVAATALALGIGVNTAVFSLVNAVLIRGLPFDGASEIVYLATRNTTGDDGDNGTPASWREFQEWRTRARSFDGIAGFIQGQMNISDPDHPAERVSGASVSANTFRLLRQQPVIGRDFAVGEDAPGAAPVVIIGHQIWKNRFASDPNVLGRPLKIAEVTYTIIGVMPERMRFPTNADLWRPLLPPARVELHTARNVGVFARLARGVSWAQAELEMAGISQALRTAHPQTNTNVDAWLMSFNRRFNGGPVRVVFLMLLGAVAFVLLIACANVANLLLARSVYRAREVAVRTALGASRGRIIRQLLIESVLLACLGGLAGLGLTVIGVRTFAAAVSDVGKPYWIVFDLDYSVFGYFAIVCLATGIVFGLAPAVQVSRTNLNDLMKEGGRGTAGGSRARWLTSALVVVELTLTLALLTGAGLMARSFLKLYTLQLGVDTAHIMTMRTQLIAATYPKPEQRQLFFDTVLTRLRAIPGVAAAALSSTLPLSGGGELRFEIEGRQAQVDAPGRRVLVADISPSYFDTMGVGIVRGRSLIDTDGAPGSDFVVVNQRLAAAYLPGEDPIGRRIRLLTGEKEDQPGRWFTIVGVSPTIRQGDIQALEPAAVIYQPYRLNSSTGMVILVRTTGDPALHMNAVREAVKSIDPEQPIYALHTLNSVLEEVRWPYRVFGSLFVIFAIIALVLSSVGVYAITAYAVTQRTQEIGVRLALGAQPNQISWLVLKTGLIQLGVGLALGLAGAWGVSLLLSSIVAQIPATDPLTFVGITLLLTVVTLAACLIPARRATRLDPQAALRID